MGMKSRSPFRIRRTMIMRNAERQNSTAEKQKAESSSLKKEGKEEDGDQARHCEQTQGMQGQNLAQVQVQEA